MATQTQSITRPGVRESRVHDHVYDPHYIVSGAQDYDIASRRARDASTHIKHQPVYRTMFSDLRQYPRLRLVPDTIDRLPVFMSEQRIVEQINIHEDPQVTGINRYKYFRRPLVSIGNSSVPPAILDADSKSLPLWRAGGPRIGESVRNISSYRDRTLPAAVQRHQLLPDGLRAHKTTHTQTDYRESEAQTEPYSPGYVVKPGCHPEVLTIASLSYGHGLPAGLAEVEMIERMREKREWESKLPPLNDVSQHARRRRLMEQQELKEWRHREQEIEKLQEEKLELMIKLLEEREKQDQLRTSQHCDKIWSAKQEEKSGKINEIGHDYKRNLRKLSAKRNKVEGRLQRTTLVEQYGDFGSQAYAPLTRIGVFIDRNSNKYTSRNPLLESYKGLCEIDRSVPDTLSRSPKPPERRTTTSAGFTRRKYREEEKLDKIYDAIKKTSEIQDARVKPLRFLEKIERPPPRPPTPSVEGPSADQEEIELAVTFIQSMLKGRCIQNSMYESITQRSDLLKELCSTHALHEVGQQNIAVQKLETLQQQHQHSEQLTMETEISGVLSSLEGETVGDILDFLSKELVRLKEERRIHAYSLLAERVRRMREAEESGTRQVEERRRREVDEIFRQITKVNQTSVDEYLQSIVLCSVDEVATEQAREEIERVAQLINIEAHDTEQRKNKLESEEIVADLVHSFLLPEAQRQALRENVRRNQQKFLLAAHQEVYSLRDELYAVTPLKKPTGENEFSEYTFTLNELNESTRTPRTKTDELDYDEVDNDEDKYLTRDSQNVAGIQSDTPRSQQSISRRSPSDKDEEAIPKKSVDMTSAGCDDDDEGSQLDHGIKALTEEPNFQRSQSAEESRSQRSNGRSNRAALEQVALTNVDGGSAPAKDFIPGDGDEKQLDEVIRIRKGNESSRVGSRNAKLEEEVKTARSDNCGRSSASEELRTSTMKSDDARKSISPTLSEAGVDSRSIEKD